MDDLQDSFEEPVRLGWKTEVLHVGPVKEGLRGTVTGPEGPSTSVGCRGPSPSRPPRQTCPLPFLSVGVGVRTAVVGARRTLVKGKEGFWSSEE